MSVVFVVAGSEAAWQSVVDYLIVLVSE